MPDRRLTLVIRAPNGDVREVELDGSIVIGRDESADVRVEDKKVSRRHAAFRLIEGEPYVEDLGSSNGVKLDGVRIDGRTRIRLDSEVRVGGYVIVLRPGPAADEAPTHAVAVGEASLFEAEETSLASGPRPSREPRRPEDAMVLLGLAPPVVGGRYALAAGTWTLGRQDACDVAILDASISRTHARLVFHPETGAKVEDLGSANGVFVNGRRVKSRELRHGDVIRFGEVDFEVELPPAVRDPSPSLGSVTEGRRSLTLVAGLGVGLLLAIVTGLWLTFRSSGASEEASPGGGIRAGASTKGSTTAAAGSISLDESSSLPPDRPFGPIRTATAPSSPRGADGLPVGIPTVNPAFDLLGFVATSAEAAKSALARADLPEARRRLEAILEVDPIHREAIELLARVSELEAGEAAMKGAETMIAEGRFAEAYRLLSRVPADLPQAAAAAARAEGLRERAFEDALARAEAATRRPEEWGQAHALFVEAVNLEPENPEALRGLRSLERKMRARKLAFEPWASSGSSGRSGASTSPPRAAPSGWDAVVDLYVRGDVETALRQARRYARRARGEQREVARRAVEGMQVVVSRFPRIRTEIPNDASRAWAMLLEVEEIERRFLPEGRRSYMVQELRADLSDAFAKLGEVMFDTRRYEAAFQRWEAGLKLDASNARILAGFERLKRVARETLEEARVAARRGADERACERFRSVTRLTRSSEPLHREARRLALEACR